MAKKATQSGFNMAEEVRTVLRGNRNLTGAEVYAALKEKYPNQKINEASCSVAFSAARKKLGIKGGRRRKTGMTRTVTKKRPATTMVSVDVLQATARFINEIGDAEKAIEAVKQVAKLQVK